MDFNSKITTANFSDNLGISIYFAYKINFIEILSYKWPL